MNEIQEKIISAAKTHLGLPYVWGGESMEEGGFDCSGFVYHVLTLAGIKVVRSTAKGYYNKFKDNECDKNVPAALLFFGKNKTNISHIAISLGGGYMIESIGDSSNTKKNVGKGVCISKISRRKDLVYAALPFELIPEVPKLAKYTLRQGSKGFEVNYLQEDLNYTINAKLKVDGSFGPLTKKALMLFQKAVNISVDGIYGPQTYKAMKGELY